MEEWRKIKGCKYYFEVSNLGNVRTVDHYEIFRGQIRYVVGRPINIQQKHKRMHVVMSDGTKKTISLKKAVYEAFIGDIARNEYIYLKDQSKGYIPSNLYKVSSSDRMKITHKHNPKMRFKAGRPITTLYIRDDGKKFNRHTFIEAYGVPPSSGEHIKPGMRQYKGHVFTTQKINK